LHVPIIALSQLSRATETRGGDKKPILSDLRESGAIEQDADIVIFLYRAEYYKILTDEDGNNTQGTAEIIVAKHRNGPLDTVKAKFIGRFAKFADFDEFGKDETYQSNTDSNKGIYKKFGSKVNNDIEVDVERKHKPEDFDNELPPF